MSAFQSSCFKVSAFGMNRTPFEIERRNFLHFVQNSPENEIEMSGGAPPHLRYEACPPVSKFRLILMIRTPFKIGRRNFLHFAQNSPENEIQIEGGHLHI